MNPATEAMLNRMDSEDIRMLTDELVELKRISDACPGIRTFMFARTLLSLELRAARERVADRCAAWFGPQR